MHTATLTLEPGIYPAQPRNPRLLEKLLGRNPHFELHNELSPGRTALEDYIRACFARSYAADVNVFAPLLLELRCAGSISGTVGIRPAHSATLFVEQYLDRPAEQIVSATANGTVRRADIVEVCNLAALRPGACQLITLILAASLRHAGYRFALLAGTRQLRKIMTKQNFAMRELTDADPTRLGTAAEQWGSYYDTCPAVLLVDLEESLGRIKEQLLPAALLHVLSDTTTRLADEFAATRLDCSGVPVAATC